MPQYNPHDMVPMVINNRHTSGRPFRFDSEIVDFNEFRNASGVFVKPSMLSSCCPDCGGGLEVPVSLTDPPFAPVIMNCPLCQKAAPIVNPFENPVESGRVDPLELDPLQYDHNQNLDDDGLTVADRLGAVDGGELDEDIIDENVPEVGENMDLKYFENKMINGLRQAAPEELSEALPEAVSVKADIEPADEDNVEEDVTEDAEDTIEEDDEVDVEDAEDVGVVEDDADDAENEGVNDEETDTDEDDDSDD